ncbi:unnamed protein product [Lasius platythorax]|uniref:Odorant receptor n=1 Tax=Lasius platythorax TaxID=488582 RepID=A0AAV2NCK7_9HYME
MSFYDNRYYYINKTFLSLIGQWPFQSRLEGNVMLATTLFFICSLTAFELLSLIEGITNPSVFMQNTSQLLMDSLIFAKLVNSIYNKYKMKDLLEHIEQTWKTTQIGPENEILRSHAEQSRTLTIQYAFIIYFMGLFYSTMPLVVKRIHSLLPTNGTYETRFLYNLEHILDVDKYFNLLMLHGIISIFLLLSVGIATDSMFILCIQHVSALFEIVRYNLKCIRDSDIVMLKPDIADDEAYHIIIRCIKSYKRALNYSELLSSTYAVCNFFLIGNVIISLSISATEATMVKNQLDELIQMIAANTGQLTHIFALSLISQRLIDRSSRLHEAVYSCNWYEISLRSRQLLRFTLMRTLKPCEIKVGKIHVMSLANFSAILQVSMSYFTMLSSLQ